MSNKPVDISYLLRMSNIRDGLLANYEKSTLSKHAINLCAKKGHPRISESSVRDLFKIVGVSSFSLTPSSNGFVESITISPDNFKKLEDFESSKANAVLTDKTTQVALPVVTITEPKKRAYGKSVPYEERGFPNLINRFNKVYKPEIISDDPVKISLGNFTELQLKKFKPILENLDIYSYKKYPNELKPAYFAKGQESIDILRGYGIIVLDSTQHLNSLNR